MPPSIHVDGNLRPLRRKGSFRASLVVDGYESWSVVADADLIGVDYNVIRLEIKAGPTSDRLTTELMQALSPRSISFALGLSPDWQTSGGDDDAEGSPRPRMRRDDA